MTIDYSTVDFLRDESLIDDPYPYYEFVRSQGTVWREPHRGAFIVTGYQALCTVFRDSDIFSSCNGFAGPFHDMPQTGLDDVSDLIDNTRDQFAFHQYLVTFDPPTHSAHRGLMMPLLNSKQIQENSEALGRLADELIDRFASAGTCDFVAEYAQPFSLLAIADLLGVPDEDRLRLRETIVANGPVGSLREGPKENPLWYLEDFFRPYIEERRRHPRDDALTTVALASFPDGSTPELMDAVRAAAFLFAGGQGTAARFQVGALQTIAERPELQERLRSDPQLISQFIEEMLRWGSPTKISFRMARKSTTLDGVHIPAGSTIMLFISAADRDPHQFECPAEFRIDRPDSRQHVAFGRGAHTCPGGPLVRAEGRITIQKTLDRLHDIRVSEAEHGAPGARRWKYTPSYILRGVECLHLEFST